MEFQCTAYTIESIEAWIDGESGLEARKIEAHVLECQTCMDVCERRRVYLERMRRFQSETDVRALPFDMLKKTRLALNHADSLKSKKQGFEKGRIQRRLFFAAAIFGVAMIGAFALNLFRINQPLKISVLQAMDLNHKKIETIDPDIASNWMSRELSSKTPTINLSLVNVSLVSASVDQEMGVGELRYLTTANEEISLFLSLKSPIEKKGMQEVIYMSSKYFCEEGANNRIEWDAEGKSYVVISAVKMNSLLPIVREMDIHCRRRAKNP